MERSPMNPSIEPESFVQGRVSDNPPGDDGEALALIAQDLLGAGIRDVVFVGDVEPEALPLGPDGPALRCLDPLDEGARAATLAELSPLRTVFVLVADADARSVAAHQPLADFVATALPPGETGSRFVALGSGDAALSELAAREDFAWCLAGEPRTLAAALVAGGS